MTNSENTNSSGQSDRNDAAADAEFRRWVNNVVLLPAPPYGFARVLVRAHRRKMRRRLAAATASVLSVALLFGGLITGGVLPGLDLTGRHCPNAATAPALSRVNPVGRRTEYTVSAAPAVIALTAHVLVGCNSASGNGSPTGAAGQRMSPPTSSPSSNQSTLPSGPADNGAIAIPQCMTADLNATVSLVAGSQTASNALLNITLINTSGHACSVHGFPGLGLEDRNEDKQSTAVTWDSTVLKTTITLNNGGSASSTARFDPDQPGPGEPISGPCEESSVYMLVTPPNNQTQLVATIKGTASSGITVCQSGALDVSALVPGTTGPEQ